MKTRKIKLCGQEYTGFVREGHYPNGRAALYMVDAEIGEPITKFTLNLTERECPKGEVWIKSYAENEGVREWLIAEGLIERESEAVATLPFGNVVSRHKLIPQKKMTGPLDSCDSHQKKEN